MIGADLIAERRVEWAEAVGAAIPIEIAKSDVDYFLELATMPSPPDGGPGMVVVLGISTSSPIVGQSIIESLVTTMDQMPGCFEAAATELLGDAVRMWQRLMNNL